MASEVALLSLFSRVLSMKDAFSSPVTLTWEISYFNGLNISFLFLEKKIYQAWGYSTDSVIAYAVTYFDL